MNDGVAARLRHPIFDFAGFALGLALAAAFGWKTKDLVWGLWLSSLVFGYATLVFGIAGAVWRQSREQAGKAIAAGVFLLLFFTVHFGMFHFVHSVFLGLFFPVVERGRMPFDPQVYATVVADYWPWLLAAAIGERGHLLTAFRGEPRGPGKGSAAAPGEAPQFTLAAYRNVVRMHLLIFVFAACSLVGLDHFAIYALVYAVYFWPRRSAPSVRGPANAVDA